MTDVSITRRDRLAEYDERRGGAGAVGEGEEDEVSRRRRGVGKTCYICVQPGADSKDHIVPSGFWSFVVKPARTAP